MNSMTTCAERVGGALVLAIGVAATAVSRPVAAATVDHIIIDSARTSFSEPRFNVNTHELFFFQPWGVLLSDGTSGRTGAGSFQTGLGALQSVRMSNDRIVAEFSMPTLTNFNSFSSHHAVRLTLSNSTLFMIGTLDTSDGYIVGTAQLTRDEANPRSEEPASVPVGTIIEVIAELTLRDNAQFTPDTFTTDFSFDALGFADLSRPVRAGFLADCNQNQIIDGVDFVAGLDPDCQSNSRPDTCDIANGQSLDCDGNGVPDECDPDCNVNMVSDACDLTSGFSADCNSNGVPDECEPDCNQSGAPDDCDIQGGLSNDCNNNSFPDECDVQLDVFDLAGTLAALDANNASLSALIPDRFDFSEGMTGTQIVDGGQDMYDGGNLLNTNRRFTIDYTNNKVADGTDGFGVGSEYFTAKFAGLFVMASSGIDIEFFRIRGNTGADGLGSTDSFQFAIVDRGKTYDVFARRIYAAGDPSINHLIIVPRIQPLPQQTISPSTGDELHEVSPLTNVSELFYLLTARAGGLRLEQADAVALALAFIRLLEFETLDCNGNSIPDSCEPDCNENGQPDDCEPFVDCNENVSQDFCDIAAGTSDDCNVNGVPDECDVAGAGSLDCDADLVPDECEADGDADGVIDDCDSCLETKPLLIVEGDGCAVSLGPCCFGASICISNTAVGDCVLTGGRYFGDGMTCESDNDADLVAACADQCPFDPEKIAPGICGCGTPDVDFDADGVVACLDICPNTPNGLPVNDCGCAAIGACCFAVGVCFDNTEAMDCPAIGGIHQGDGSTCADGCGFGDANGDGRVDLMDLAVIQGCFGRSLQGGCSDLDADGCGSLNLDDYATFFSAITGP